MRRRWPIVLLSFVLSLLLTGPVLAQESTAPSMTLDRDQTTTSSPEGSPSAEDEPDIDLLSHGAWGIASRDFEQAGEDLDFPLFFTTSIAAFSDEEAAEDAFPLIVEQMLSLEQYQTLEAVETDAIADEQMFHYGEFESEGFTFNVGILVVRNGEFLTLSGSVAFETHDGRDGLIELSTVMNDGLEDASPETGDDLIDLLPDPEDLPGADELSEPYLVEDEDVRLAE